MEYSQLINRLLEAEQGAQSIVQEARGRETSMESELARESAELRASFFAQADRQIQSIDREAQAGKAAALEAQDKRRDEAMCRMERAYERYGDNWVDTLFHRIVGDRA